MTDTNIKNTHPIVKLIHQSTLYSESKMNINKNLTFKF